MLDTRFPTLAEYLASKGYSTAGFASNTTWCGYETRLDRGFARYEDYEISPRTILACGKIGRWLVSRSLDLGNYRAIKWVLKFQSRNAGSLNRAFLDWQRRQRTTNRPFFAFLNYIDAHAPYLVSKDRDTHFGLRPETPGDYNLLLRYSDIDKRFIRRRNLILNRDSYDDCLADLDAKIGALLDELERRDVLQNTIVIVTSDHGEEFADHGLFGHSASLYMHEIHVPLVILPGANPASSRIVSEAVSLRDLPATIVDLVGLKTGSPFPGALLASLWRAPVGRAGANLSPAISDHWNPPMISLDHGLGPAPPGFSMSQLADGLHYIRDGSGKEELYDLKKDPLEVNNLIYSSTDDLPIDRFRRSLLQILNDAAPPRAPYLERYKRDLEFKVPDVILK